MVRKIDITGNVYNEIKVLSRSPDNYRMWSCLCVCGAVFSTTKQRLVEGRTKSCGCKKSEFLAAAHKKHGGYKDGKNSRTYQSYIAMMHRCYDDTRVGWHRYGGRGIIVSESRWLEKSPKGFLNFLEDMGERPVKTTLNRIDNDGNYCKDNCQWDNKRVQAHNSDKPKKNNHTSKYRGVSKRATTNTWMARIGNGAGGYTWLGEFKEEVDAALAYNFAALELFGDGAFVNE